MTTECLIGELHVTMTKLKLIRHKLFEEIEWKHWYPTGKQDRATVCATESAAVSAGLI